MEALPAAQGPGDCKGLLEQLSQQVTTLAARLEDLEEHVSDLSTDVRLQACKGLPPLSTAGSHDGSLHNSSGQHCPAILSPRVAGPAAVRVRSRHASLVGACSGLAPGSATAAPASEESAATAGAPEPSAAVSTPGLESAVDAPKLGALEGMKMWGEGVLEDKSEQALQLATAAAAAAADAQAAADRYQQQVLELRGRQGQAERRVDTLWQLQEGAANNQAAILQLQAQLEQQQQAQQQQQENMSALRAQVLQSNLSCAANVSTCADLRSSLQQLQQQLEQCCSDVSKQANQMLETTQQQQAATNKVRTELQAAQQQVTQQLGARQAALDSCTASAQAAQGRCEDLRQGAVVLAGRCDAITGAIKAAVEPLNAKMAEIEARASSWSKAAALAKSAVQKEELAAGLAQLSTAGSRRDHERAQQVAGLASRLEVLEQHPAARDEVVTLEDLQSKLAEVRASLAASLTQSTRELQAALCTKADEAATSKVTSSLAERLNSSETSLMLAVRALRDKAAVLIDSKADAAGLKRWQQEVADSIADLRALQVAQAGGGSGGSRGAAGASAPVQHQQRLSPRRAQQVSPRQLVGLSYHGPAKNSLLAAQQQQQPQQAAGSRRSPGKQRNTVAAGYREYEHSLPAAAALTGVLGSQGDLDLHLGGAEGDAMGGGALSVSQCAAAAEAALAALLAVEAPPRQLAAATGVADQDSAVSQEAAVRTGEPGNDRQPQAVPAAAALAPACQQEHISTEAAGSADDSAAPVISGSTVVKHQAWPAAATAFDAAASITPAGSPITNADPAAAPAAAAAAAAGSAPPSTEGAAPAAAQPAPAAPSEAAAPPTTSSASSPGGSTNGHLEAVTVSNKQPGRKSVHQRSQSQIGSTSAAQAGSHQHVSQQAQQPAGAAAAAAAAAAGRPFSALQPWSAPASPPSTSAASLHSAATNAKLLLAGQHKEAARQQLAHKKLPASRGAGAGTGAPAAASPKQHHNRSSSVSSVREAVGEESGQVGSQLPGQLSERRHASSEGGRVGDKADAMEIVGKMGGHSQHGSLGASLE